MGKAERLLELADEMAANTPRFFDIKGPGHGNRSTNSFVLALNAAAISEFGDDFSERVFDTLKVDHLEAFRSSKS